MVRGTLIVLGEPLAYFGSSCADDRVVTWLVVRSTTEHLGSDHPLAEQIAFSRKRALNDVLQECLALAATPEGHALQNTLQSLPDLGSVGVRCQRSTQLSLVADLTPT